MHIFVSIRYRCNSSTRFKFEFRRNLYLKSSHNEQLKKNVRKEKINEIKSTRIMQEVSTKQNAHNSLVYVRSFMLRYQTFLIHLVARRYDTGLPQ